MSFTVKVLTYLLLFLSILPVSFFADNYFRVYPVKRSAFEFDFYADNLNYCPYQIKVGLKVEKIAGANAVLPYYAVIPAQTSNVYLFTATSFGYDIGSQDYSVDRSFGDPLSVNTNYDTAWIFPYENGAQFKVNQYYNTRFSHNGWTKYSIDFGLNMNTPVCAARDGVVVAIDVENSKGGLRRRYRNMANYIILAHSNGTFSQYVHLIKDGCTIQIGDRVKAGQVIGYSGNTGWTSGPHLHFMAFVPTYMAYMTIPTKFYTEQGFISSLKTRGYYVSYHPTEASVIASLHLSTNGTTNSISHENENLGGP